MTQEPEGIALPFFFIGTEDVPIQLSNLQVVQHVQHEFVITFAQFSPPLVLGTPEEQRAQVASKPYVPVKTIARIAMAPERMLALIRVLQENYDNWLTAGGKPRQ
ncbi:MAG: hypothetical protein Q7T33_10445 [Dehalococcoidia bacterium]|nr:hypothetical protein [Dehalococcoidia bacterium]